MVRVIMGVKGTGKTKQMIDLINTAVQNEHGNVVCIERGPKLTYDITHVFIDSLTKIVPSEATSLEVENFLDWLNNFGEDNNIKFTVTISADESLASDGVKKYF